MHVALRHADQACGHPGPTELDGVGVRARTSWLGLDLIGNFLLFCHLHQPLVHDRAGIGPAQNDRPPAQLALADLALINIWMVRCPRHIHGNAHQRIDSVRTGLGSPQPHFLLYGSHRIHGSAALALSAAHPPQRLGDHPSTGLIVNPPRYHQPIAQFLKVGVVGRRIADGHQLPRLVRVGCTDIDPQVVFVRYFGAIRRLHQVNGLFAQYTQDRPLRCVDAHLAARHDLQVKAADGIKVQIAFVVDVNDLETQLVGVPGEHNLGATSFVVDADGIAVHIDLDAVGVFFYRVLPHRPHRPLVTRRAGSTE